MNIPCDFKDASPEFANEKIAKFDGENHPLESALTQLIEVFPENTSLPHVLLKVAAINSLYSTQIYGVREVARKIVDCGIDKKLKDGDTGVVDDISWASFLTKEGKEKKRRNYSFATKYCAWHKPEKYPLYDSRVETCLRAYQQKRAFTSPFNYDDLKNYARFREVVDAFRTQYLNGFSYKRIDMFLYQLGSDCFYSTLTSSATPPPQPAH
jgi:hypothetical protein